MSIPIRWVNIEDRFNLGTWLNDHGLTGSMAEIGVLHGGFSNEVLSKWKGERYYMVDIWARQDASIYRERTDGMDYESCYRQCRAMADKDKRIVMIRKLSLEAAREVPDGSLDAAYIDANHAYQPVLDDMDAWWCKVRPGGIMGLHDYGNDTTWPNFCEVKSAVDRWCSERQLAFAYSRCNSVWIAKHSC